MQDRWNEELRRAYDRGYWDRDREIRERQARSDSGHQGSDYQSASERRPGYERSLGQRSDNTYSDYPPGDRDEYGDYERRYGSDRQRLTHVSDNDDRFRDQTRGYRGAEGRASGYGGNDRQPSDDELRERRDDRSGNRLNGHRDFFSRASDEVRSWLGDEHALNRRRMDDVRENYDRQHRWDELRDHPQRRDEDRRTPF